MSNVWFRASMEYNRAGWNIIIDAWNFVVIGRGFRCRNAFSSFIYWTSVVQANLVSVLIIQYLRWDTEPENNSVPSIVFALIICISYI